MFNYSQIDDAILFNEQFPPKEKCPKCNLVLPPGQGSTYPACCGAIVCGGCNNISFLVCISCGTLGAYDENEVLKQLKKRMHLGDAQAFNMMGVCHINGFGVKKDQEKAIELWTKGGELGCADSFRNIARLYDDDQGVGFNILKDGKAAILGDHYARHYLGWIESNDDERSMKHFRIAAKNGVRESLEVLRVAVAEGKMSKSDFNSILHDHEISVNEIKSEQRDLAAALIANGMGCNMSLGSKKSPHSQSSRKKVLSSIGKGSGTFQNTSKHGYDK